MDALRLAGNRDDTPKFIEGKRLSASQNADPKGWRSDLARMPQGLLGRRKFGLHGAVAAALPD